MKIHEIPCLHVIMLLRLNKEYQWKSEKLSDITKMKHALSYAIWSYKP